ncbi:MAG: hypothetical protein ACFFD4_16515, partial [Candidatus Odinarchaeota archaeon]
VRIIIPEGLSPGGMVSKSPKLENEKPATIMVRTIRSMLTDSNKPKKPIPVNRGTKVSMVPKINELHKFPKSMVCIETG